MNRKILMLILALAITLVLGSMGGFAETAEEPVRKDIIDTDAGADDASALIAPENNLRLSTTLDDDVRAKLIRAAIDNQEHSYAPYSKYNVSAAVLMDSGVVYTGVNVENASYPAGICAERNAIFHAVQCGERRIVAIAIVGGPNYEIHDYCAPCGICRQVMREFCVPEDMRVIFAKSVDDYMEMTLGALLPQSFGPEALEK